MNKFSLRNRSVLAATIGAVLVFGAVSQVNAQTAQDRAAERRAKQEGKKSTAAKPADEYPNATRQAEAKASSKGGPKLQKMMGLYDDDKGPQALAAADEIIATDTFNAYDSAFAAQIAAQIAYDADDTAGAKKYLQKAIELNGLDNNGHFSAMYMLAQLQLQDEQYTESLKTLDTFFAETKSTKPEQLVVKGNALYRLERYPEAVDGPEAGHRLLAEPEAGMAAAADGDLRRVGPTRAKRPRWPRPSPPRTRTTSAPSSTWPRCTCRLSMFDKAAAVLEKLRASGQLTEDKEYRQLYATYLNMDGKEKEAISVINEGLQKGVLKPDYQTYLAQAQAYYFSDQAGPAIDAYKKAAPLAPDGETYLNLATCAVAGRPHSRGQGSRQAGLAKGVKKPDDAKKIIALPNK